MKPILSFHKNHVRYFTSILPLFYKTCMNIIFPPAQAKIYFTFEFLQKIRIRHYIPKPGPMRYILLNTIHMNCTRTIVTLFFCLSISALYSQKEAAQKQGMFSFSISLSDYNFVKQESKGFFSELCHEPKGPVQIGQYQLWLPGQLLETSYSPYRSFGKHGARRFSNFPAFFVKGDSIGQASLVRTPGWIDSFQGV